MTDAQCLRPQVTQRALADLNSARTEPKADAPDRTTVEKVGSWREGVVPDSEEERFRCDPVTGPVDNKPFEGVTRAVIEISSGEDDDPRRPSVDDDLFSPLIPGGWPSEQQNNRSNISSPTRLPSSGKAQKHRTRPIVWSSSSEDSDTQEVIVLTDSSSDAKKQSKVRRAPKAQNLAVEPPENIRPLYSDDYSSDNAIIVLDEPKSARKPVKLGQRAVELTTRLLGTPTRDTDPGRLPLGVKVARTADRTPVGTPNSQSSLPQPSIPNTLTSPSKTRKAPQNSKKLQAAAELARRQAYAQMLFIELNRDVFSGGLPEDTKLNWNKRLLTTAGRAKWQRSREGLQTTEIELAEKILDCDERIRNTLSHEMCHLACWIINGDPKENHGQMWKGWAAKLMRKRPEIEVTTKHSYEISYPFEWECEQCAKIYGRFSKSIRPDECVCGACKVGKLIPLFPVSKRPPKTPKVSRLAADKPQDSPTSLPLLDRATVQTELDNLTINVSEVGRKVSKASTSPPEVVYIHGSDSEPGDLDSEVQVLAAVLNNVSISNN